MSEQGRSIHPPPAPGAQAPSSAQGSSVAPPRSPEIDHRRLPAGEPERRAHPGRVRYPQARAVDAKHRQSATSAISTHLTTGSAGTVNLTAKFIHDLLQEHETEIRDCLRKGAHKVQIDFTEGRLAVKIDPSGKLLNSFIDLNNLALQRFSAEDRQRIGVHTCPGSDRDSTHSAEVDYAELLPSLFELRVGNFYIALAGEHDRVRVLKIIREFMKPDQRVFVGVVSPIDPRVDSPEEIRDRILEAAEYIPADQLGTTDDCGYSPFSDDSSTTRDTAFAKIRARVLGTALAADMIGSG